MRARNYADTAAAERTEKLAGYARRVLHVLTDNGDGGQSAFRVHWEHGTRFNLFFILPVQHFDRPLCILVSDTDGSGVLR